MNKSRNILATPDGIEGAIRRFARDLPGWWYSVGDCQVSADASCAPTIHSKHNELISQDRSFDSGFHTDLRKDIPGLNPTPAMALDHIRLQALERIAEHQQEPYHALRYATKIGMRLWGKEANALHAWLNKRGPNNWSDTDASRITIETALIAYSKERVFVTPSNALPNVPLRPNAMPSITALKALEQHGMSVEHVESWELIGVTTTCYDDDIRHRMTYVAYTDIQSRPKDCTTGKGKWRKTDGTQGKILSDRNARRIAPTAEVLAIRHVLNTRKTMEQ